jgi:hypothetical protein
MSSRKERRDRFNLKRFLKGLSGPEHDAAIARAYGAGSAITPEEEMSLEEFAARARLARAPFMEDPSVHMVAFMQDAHERALAEKILAGYNKRQL